MRWIFCVLLAVVCASCEDDKSEYPQTVVIDVSCADAYMEGLMPESYCVGEDSMATSVMMADNVNTCTITMDVVSCVSCDVKGVEVCKQEGW